MAAHAIAGGRAGGGEGGICEGERSAPDRGRARDCGMSPVVDDDDDWVGTPPEGRYSRDRARPDFWRAQWRVPAIGGGLLVAIVIVLVVVLALR